LKILHVLSQRPDSTGSGFYIQAMIKESAACGHDNFLVAGVSTTKNDKIDFIEKDKSLFVNFSNADVSYQIPGMSDVMPYESKRFCDLSTDELDEYERSFTKVLKTAVDRFKPDIIHSHHLWIVSAITRQLFPNIPMVTSCHGSDLRQFQNCPHLQEKVTTSCREIEVVIALTMNQKEEITRLYNINPEKIIIAGTGYNEKLFYPEIKPAPNPIQIVYAGKLSNAKGVPWLLRALQSIELPDWKLHLIGSGSGDEKELCLKLAKQLDDKVQIYGAIPQSSLAKIMRRSHIFVLPSFFEGLPLVVLEALASGCRVVATNLPGIEEMIGNSKLNFISLVKTPRLRFIDQPYQEDEVLFEQELQEALQNQIDAAYEFKQFDISQIKDKLNSYTWTGIFNKVKEAYLKCLK